MALVRWDPFRELGTVHERMNRLFSDFSSRDWEEVIGRGAWMPPVDIYETDKHELVIKAELPDMNRDDLEVTVQNNMLTLKGERKFDREVKEDHYHRVERSYGSFCRSFSLPATVDSNKVSAEYKNGVLTVRLPIREDAKPKQIPVEAAA